MKIPQIVRPLVPVVLAISLAACDDRSPAAPSAHAGADRNRTGITGQKAQPVTTTTTRSENVPVTLLAQGNVLPLDEVDIRPQKTGIISAIHVREGEDVKRGQVLFALDDREDQANLRKAEAALAGAQTQVAIAQRQHARNVDLFNRNFVSAAALDATRNQLESLASQVAQDHASVEQLRTVLSYSTIRAPFDGRAGRIDVRPGSLVLANTTTAMVRITRLDPIAVLFNLAESDLARLRAVMAHGPVMVAINVPGQAGRPIQGKVVFIENSVDTVSGTIGVKAQVANPHRALWPGQYVTVSIAAGELADAVVLPPQSIVNGPDGSFVYVVQPDMTVVPRPLELVRISSEAAVVKGIEAGVKVVLEGAANLRPGSKVSEARASVREDAGARSGTETAAGGSKGQVR